MYSPVTEIRPDRSYIDRSLYPIEDPNLRLDLTLETLFTNTIKRVLSKKNTPLEADKLSDDRPNWTVEDQSTHTLKRIFKVVGCDLNYYANSINFKPGCKPDELTGDTDSRAIIAYLMTCEPIKLSTVLTTLAVYKHLAFTAKEKWRHVYWQRRYYDYDAGLAHSLSQYMFTHYIDDIIQLGHRSGVEGAHSRYSQPAPNIYWFLQPQDRWIVNNMTLEETCESIVSSGLITIYKLFAKPRVDSAEISYWNFLTTEDAATEYLSDILTVTTNSDLFEWSRNMALDTCAPQTFVKYLHSGVKRADAATLKRKFKRFHRVRTQLLMSIPYLLNSQDPFSTDIMALEFEAEGKPELKSVANAYRNFCSKVTTNLTAGFQVTPRPFMDVIPWVKEYQEAKTAYAMETYVEAHCRPAVAICNVMRGLYTYTQNIAILNSHLDGYL
jgi:hypothetical protein